MKPAAPRPPDGDPFRDPVATALIALAAERGYENVAAEDVAVRAGISREQFDGRFGGLEECARVTLDLLIGDFLWSVGSAYSAFPDWRTGLRAAAYAAADWIDEHPDATRFGMVEVLKARDEMLRVRREEVFVFCGELIDRGRDTVVGPVPEAAPLMAIGAVAQTLTRRLQTGAELSARETAREMLYLAVRPYVGEEAAREELTAPRPELPGPI